MKIVNTWFKQKREHLITYKSGDLESQIDCITLRQSGTLKAKNCKEISGEECLTQHRLLCYDVNIKNFGSVKQHWNKGDWLSLLWLGSLWELVAERSGCGLYNDNNNDNNKNNNNNNNKKYTNLASLFIIFS